MALTLDDLAAYIGVPAAELVAAGIAEGATNGKLGVSVPYKSTDGGTLFTRTRTSLDVKWMQPKGVPREPFGLERLALAREAGAIVLCEGETDSLALRHHGIPVLGVPGNSWQERWNSHLDEIPLIHVVRENDDHGGAQFVKSMREHGPADRCRVIHLPEDVKDVVEFARQHDDDSFAEAWQELVDDSTPLVERPRLLVPYTWAQVHADATALGEGLSTGIAALDDAGFSLERSCVHAILARPGQGKTAWMLHTCARIVEGDPDATAVFVTFEGSRVDLFIRLLLRQVAIHRIEAGDEPGAPWYRDTRRWIRTGRVFEHEGRGDSQATQWEHELVRAQEVVSDQLMPRLFIVDGDAVWVGDEPRALKLSEITSALGCEAIRPTIVAFDYFQKLKPDDRRSHRIQQLQALSDELRVFAKGYGNLDRASVVLTGSQANRDSAGQPRLHHIREGDDLGQDAHTLLSLHTSATYGHVRHITLSAEKSRTGVEGATAEVAFYADCGYFCERTDDTVPASTRITRARIRADVEAIYNAARTASQNEVEKAVQGNTDEIRAAYREIFKSGRDG